MRVRILRTVPFEWLPFKTATDRLEQIRFVGWWCFWSAFLGDKCISAQLIVPDKNIYTCGTPLIYFTYTYFFVSAVPSQAVVEKLLIVGMLYFLSQKELKK